MRSNKNVGEWDFDKLFAMDENLKRCWVHEDFMDSLLKDDKTAEEDDFEQPDTETLRTDIKLGILLRLGSIG